MGKRYHCAVELAVDVIGGKWRPVILAHLKEGVHRYGELRRRIPDMSEKMLAQRLRELQEDGLIERIDYAAKPAHVEYRLTDEGRSLAPVLQALYDWGTERAARTATPIHAPTDAPADEPRTVPRADWTQDARLVVPAGRPGEAGCESDRCR